MGDSLDPAEGLLDPLADALADGIARMSHGIARMSHGIARMSRRADERPFVFSTTSITRSRKSCEYGFGIPAGLRPASRVNQKFADFGNPGPILRKSTTL